MKQTIGFLLLAVMVAACSNDKTSAETASTTMDTSSAEVNTRGYDFGGDIYVQIAKQTMQVLASNNVGNQLPEHYDAVCHHSQLQIKDG